jgi:glutathionylspermidine synthase
MKRIPLTPRKDWVEKVEALGFTFHSLDNLYWDESAAYEFKMEEITTIENATNLLHTMCIDAVQHIIDNDLFARFGVQDDFKKLIIESWDGEFPSIYGRFDFGYNPNAPADQQLKLLEYNADTPTSLFEASVVQWFWLQDYGSTFDQFNSIHEKLIAYWHYVTPYLKHSPMLHFACLSENIEDLTTTEYLRDTAIQAGLETKLLYMEQIGFHAETGFYYDMDDEEIDNLFKLYPWEWLTIEEFSSGLYNNPNCGYFIEPAWKALLSNKTILTILWELYPDHPLLLPSYEQKSMFADRGVDYVSKPALGREGNNITVTKSGLDVTNTDGNYGDSKKIYQQLFNTPNFEGNFPIIGSWVIGGEAAGMGIRESNTLITNNTSRFVPHYIND